MDEFAGVFPDNFGTEDSPFAGFCEYLHVAIFGLHEYRFPVIIERVGFGEVGDAFGFQLRLVFSDCRELRIGEDDSQQDILPSKKPPNSNELGGLQLSFSENQQIK